MQRPPSRETTNHRGQPVPASKERDYAARNVVRNVLSEAWLIYEPKLEEIVSLLELRASGVVLSEEEIKERVGFDFKASEHSDEPQIIEGGIQVIDVFGTLAPRMNLMMKFSGGTSTQKLAQQIQEAGRNEMVKTIVLRIDSPGGAASYTPEVADAIREVAKTKRVVASATNMMASGAYWIGSAATEVYASPSTMVGSIGVYTILQNVKEAYEKRGVKFTVFRAGSLKAAGNPYEELTDDRRAALQKNVLDIYSNFVSAVADHRGTTIPQVEQEFGQGSVMLAAEAAQRGMIDGVLTFEQLLAREQEQLSVSNQQSIQVGNTMNPKIKAALFARGLVASADASDELCQCALNSFAVARGIDREVTVEDLLEQPKAAEPVQVEDAPVAKPADGRNARAEERARIQELQARGSILNISKADIDAAIENDLSVEQAVMKWTENLSAVNTPITPVPGGSEVDKVASAASSVILSRCADLLGDQVTEEDRRIANTTGASLQNARTIDIVRSFMKTRDSRVTGDDYDDAKTFLAEFSIDGGSANRRGDHPDMLSSLTRKSLNAGAIIAETSYKEWVATIEPLPDFKPKSFIDHGVFKRLPAVMEDEELKQLKFNSQLENWIIADRHAAKVALTVEMIVDDDLGGFARQLRSLGLASRHTINAAALDLLNGNPNMPDGNAFFSVAHGNVITSGATVSTTQLKTHRLKHRTLSSFDSDAPMGASIRGILVPAALEEDALQTCSTSYENKYPATDSNINTFRGRVMTVVDAYLDDFSDKLWYSFIDKMQAAPMVLAFQRGFGEEGRQESWYEPNRKTRYVSVETRFGLALSNWRAMVRNAGE